MRDIRTAYCTEHMTGSHCRFLLYIKNFNASVGEGGYLPQSDRDDEDTLKTAAVFNRAEK